MIAAINQKLGMSTEQYEAMMFDAYARWCESVTINDLEFQKVLANAAISNWYMVEYAKCERQFQVKTTRYKISLTVTLLDMRTCYNDCTYRMFSIRPAALLNDIKKTTAGGYLKISGVRIPSLTFTQN